MAQVAESQVVRERYAAIAEGAELVGSIQTMNMATVGGNLCNAAPSADIAPPLLAYDAEAVIVGPSGRRTLPLEEFFLGPGKTALAADELLAEVRPSCWNYFWYWFFFFLIVPPIVAACRRAELSLNDSQIDMICAAAPHVMAMTRRLRRERDFREEPANIFRFPE